MMGVGGRERIPYMMGGGREGEETMHTVRGNVWKR